MERLKRHYWLMSFFQGIADHYTRLTKIDCSWYDHDITEDIMAEFEGELEEPIPEE